MHYVVRSRSVRSSVDEDEVSGQKASQDEVEAKRGWLDAGKKDGECDGREEDADQEGGAVLVVEAVAGFEAIFARGWSVEKTGVHEAIGGVEHPDGDRHGEDGGLGKMDVAGSCDEPCPEGGDGWGIEGEEMPEFEG
jgi:hypothetical protein